MNIKLSRYDTKSINIQRKSYGYYYNGFDNKFSNYLDGLYVNSPTQQCIVDDLAGYIIGDGLIGTDELQKATIKKFFNVNFLNRLEKLRKIHNSVCLEIVRNPLKRITQINIINPSQIRVSELTDGVPTCFKFKKTWDTRVTGYSSASSELVAYDKTSERSLLYWFDSGLFDLPYGRPSYLSATDPIEFEISLYTGDNHGAQNGLSPSTITTMATSGVPETDQEAVDAINSNLSGVANKGKNAIIFTKAGETVTPTVTLLNDNSRESKKVNYEVAESGILKGWRIPSPTLISGLNVKASGFSNPAEEMQWALNSLKTKIINPNRDTLLEILEPLFVELGIMDAKLTDLEDKNLGVNPTEEPTKELNSAIKDLTGKQFQGIERIVRKFNKEQIDREQAAMMLRAGFGLNDEEIETWLKKELTELSEVKSFEDDMMLESLEGESIDLDEWELVDTREANDEDCEEWANRLITNKPTTLELITIKLASIIKSAPNKKSSLDKDNYKVRYSYSEIAGTNRTKSRKFCKEMMGRTERGVVYRKEDIDAASFRGINNKFGHKGQNYSLWLYAGGKYCHHYWSENLYRLKTKTDGTPYKDKALSSSEEVENIKGYNPNPRGWDKANTAPINRAGRGEYPS